MKIYYCQVCDKLFQKLTKARYMAIGKDFNDYITEWFECGAHGVTQNPIDIIRLELVPLAQWFYEHDYYNITGTAPPRDKIKWHVVNMPAKPPQYLNADMWKDLDGTTK